ARAQGETKHAPSNDPGPRLARGGQLRCQNCGAVAPARPAPAEWLRIEQLSKPARRSEATHHDFCSPACAASWLVPQAPNAALSEPSEAQPSAPLVRAAQPPARRVVRLVR